MPLAIGDVVRLRKLKGYLVVTSVKGGHITMRWATAQETKDAIKRKRLLST